MFDKNNSVEDYVEKTIKKEVQKIQKEEEKLKSSNQAPPSQQKQRKKFEKKVQKYMQIKQNEFSFEVKKERTKFPEIEEIKESIAKGEEAIQLFLRSGQMKEAQQLKTSLQQARYEVEMLDCVMNLDFERPKEKAKAMADEMGIDLTDPIVIEEFKRMQQERLKELKDIQAGNKKGQPKTTNPKRDHSEYNDIFRESNRAVMEQSDENEKSELQDPNEETKESGSQNNPSQQKPASDMKLDEDEDNTYNTKNIIIGVIF